MATLLPNGRMQICGYSGTPSVWGPLVGGRIYTYIAGTSTPKATYTTAAASVENENPVELDARGEATIFWSGAYKIVVRDADDNVLYTVDNVSNAIDASSVTYGSDTLAFILLNNSTYVVDSIADLRDVEKTKFTMAYVKGYYAAGDGGGGYYYYDSGDTTTADNGGTVIVADDSGRWKLLTNGNPVSIMQFGAKADGITDASSFIQKAIDYVESIGGGEVIASGSFNIASDFTIGQNVTINGFNTKYLGGQIDPADYQTVFIITGTATIKTSHHTARIKGVMLLNSILSLNGTYPLPFASSAVATSAVSAFTHTPIDAVDGNGINLERVIFLGFTNSTTGYNVDTIDCASDCTNGFRAYLTFSPSFGKFYGNIAGNLTNLIIGGTATRSGFGIRTGNWIGDISTNIVFGFLKPVSLETQNTRVVLVGNDIAAPSGATAPTIDILAGSENGVIVIRENTLVATGVHNVISVGIDSKYVIESNIMQAATGVAFIDVDADAGYGVVRNNVQVSDGALLSGDTDSQLRCYQKTRLGTNNPISFTPYLEFDVASTGITYDVVHGSYVLQDNIVHGKISIYLTSKGSATGDARARHRNECAGV